MKRNRLFLAAAGSTLLLSAAALGLPGIRAASAATPDTFADQAQANPCLITLPNDPTGTVYQNPTGCPDPSTLPGSAIGAPLSPGGAPLLTPANTFGVPLFPSSNPLLVPANTITTPVIIGSGGQLILAPTSITTLPTVFTPAAAVVNESTFLALVAQQLGVSQGSLTFAFEQAEASVAAQGQTGVAQDLLLNLVAQQLGVVRTTLNAALQQAASAEINALLQSGQISLAQASADETAIANGQYGLGLGFGIPTISAPAV